MPEITLTVPALGELKKRLDDLGDGKVARSFMRTGARKAGMILAEGQRETVPVESGKLLSSIGVQVTGARGDDLVVRIGPSKKFNFIGRFHEFGTKYMPGSHWMQKAFDNNAQEALDAFVAEVKRKLDVRDYKELQKLQQDEGSDQ